MVDALTARAGRPSSSSDVRPGLPRNPKIGMTRRVSDEPDRASPRTSLREPLSHGAAGQVHATRRERNAARDCALGHRPLPREMRAGQAPGSPGSVIL